MKHARYLFLLLTIFVLLNTLVAQRTPHKPDQFVPGGTITLKIPPSPPHGHQSWDSSITKRAGHYTKQDWKNLIDSLWGPGISTAEKLAIFDDYWNLVDQTWGGFPNLAINWDSLKNVYRPEVAAGVSRGRFYGILSRMSRALNELHTTVVDMGIDSSLGIDYLSPTEYPNYPSYKYQPGIPIFNTGPTSFRSNFGTGVTPLPDSTALVYSVMPNHPLNLQPGDIILGYDGIPWKNLIKELYDAELPIFAGGGLIGSSPHSAFHVAMLSVGMNWGLFDTIDVFKYSTKDTVHFATSLLKSINQPYHIATEQLPIKGVPFPDIKTNKMVSWGVIEGTAIGYIYVWDWYGNPIGQTRVLFGQAVDELLHQKNIPGLILDFRTNYGGWPEYANDGFQQLFNFDPTSQYAFAQRIVGNDHNAFTLQTPPSVQFFTPGGVIFDRPIAVLLGPSCLSSGDYNAFRMRFHPMVRSFGKKTSGAYVAWRNISNRSWNQTYYSSIYDGSVYSNYNNEGYMIHKSFPVDEEVWLTQAGVAIGDDDVVKRAMEWISSAVHAHHLKPVTTHLKPGIDSVRLTVRLSHPNNSQAAVTALLSNAANTIRDSLRFFDDGVHGDSAAGDGFLAAIGKPIPQEGEFFVTLRTYDGATGKSFTLPSAIRLYTSGPLKISKTTLLGADTIGLVGHILNFQFEIANMGITDTITNVSLSFYSPDTMITLAAYPGTYTIPPGGSIATFQQYLLVKSNALDRHRAPVIMSGTMNGYPAWSDTMWFTLKTTGILIEDDKLPKVYALEQNYPNPFNPITVISYALPTASRVRLSVFDLLGREVALLVNDEKPAGTYKATWDASTFPSGVYFYRLSASTSSGHAGNSVNTKRLVLIK